MRKIAFATIAMTAMAAFSLPAAAGPSNNWHVHDGGASPYRFEMRSAGVAIFPLLFAQEGLTYDAASDPARCPDATDKAGTLLDGKPSNRPGNNGICQTDDYIIFLRSASGGSDQVPPNVDGSVPFGADTLYYRLTPRGQ